MAYDIGTDNKANPRDFPVGSPFRRVLEKNEGRIPGVPDKQLDEYLGRFNVEEIERLTPAIDANAYELVKQIEKRLGLPEVPVYVLCGDEPGSGAAYFSQKYAAILIRKEILQEPRNCLESIILHEIGHGIEDCRFATKANEIVFFFEDLLPFTRWSDHLFEATSCLYRAASVFNNIVDMFSEAEADRFSIRNACDLSGTLERTAACFRAEHPKTASFDEGKSPLTALSVFLDIMNFNPATRIHPPTSIRYLVAAREVALETERRRSL